MEFLERTDEAAEIDGCGKITTLFRISASGKTGDYYVLYLCVLLDRGDFFQPLIFMNSVERFTIPLALNMYLDPNSITTMVDCLAMSVILCRCNYFLYYLPKISGGWNCHGWHQGIETDRLAKEQLMVDMEQYGICQEYSILFF